MLIDTLAEASIVLSTSLRRERDGDAGANACNSV